MAQVAQLSLTDGQGTPVAHIFKRMPSMAANITAFRDSTASLVTAARSVLTGSYRASASNNDGAKRTWNLSVPEYDSTSKKVVGTARAKIEYLLPDALGIQTKKDLGAYLKALVNSAEFQAEFSSDDPVQ